MQYTVQIDSTEPGAEVVVLDEENDDKGDLVGIRATVRSLGDGSDSAERSLAIALVNRDFNSPISGQRLRLEPEHAPAVEALTDSAGMAEFPLTFSGALVISIPD